MTPDAPASGEIRKSVSDPSRFFKTSHFTLVPSQSAPP